MSNVRDMNSWKESATVIPDDNKRAFALSLIDYMSQNQLSVYAFSKEIGIDRSTVTHWLNGENLPKTDQLFRISEHTGYSFDRLFGRIPEKDHTNRLICEKTFLSENSVEALRHSRKFPFNSGKETLTYARLVDLFLDLDNPFPLDSLMRELAMIAELTAQDENGDLREPGFAAVADPAEAKEAIKTVRKHGGIVLTYDQALKMHIQECLRWFRMIIENQMLCDPTGSRSEE